MGYSNGQLAKRFWAFGLSFGAGALLGYFASFLMMGHFLTSVMRRDFARNHHSFSLAALACFGDPANDLLYGSRDWLCQKTTTNTGTSLIEKVSKSNQGQRRKRAPKKDKSFLKELSSSLIWGRKIYLVFCGLWLHVFCGHGSIVLWLKRLHR